MARLRGRLKRWTLGKAAVLDVGEARDQAREKLKLADQGIDPETSRRRAEANTVAAVVNDFARLYLQRRQLRTANEVKRDLERELVARFGKRLIADVTKRDLLAMLDEIAGRAPIMANRLLAHIRRFFNWAVERGILTENPAIGIRPPAREQSRDRVLTDDELHAIWKACGQLGWPGGQLVRLLAATGARRDEIAHAAWPEIDRERRALTVPPERFKSDKTHVVLLNDLALEVLEDCPVVGKSGLLFASQADTPVSNYARIKHNLDRLSGVTGWRLHDLRRTAASGMARLGTPPQALARVLGHSASAGRGGVLAVYDRYSYDREARTAVDAWGRELMRIVGRDQSTVVALRA
jgi:integrase